MKLKSLSITGFRNIPKLSLEFDPDIKIFAFTGPNGHGKTNILEAIFLLAISKSFRTNENLDLIGFDADYCSLSADVIAGEEVSKHELIITKEPPKKTLKINGLVKKAADFIGNLNVVFFSPDDIGMIHLSPHIRRRYLDLLLSQLDRDYLEDSLNYQQAIKQRNSLLKQISDGKAKEDELDFWDAKLAEFGVRIIGKREQIIKDLGEYSTDFYKKVSGEKDELKIQYEPSISTTDIPEYLEKLFAGRKRDIVNGSTNLGPHRDDLLFLCNGHDMKSFASRGEWRSLVLTLKFTEIDLLKKKKGHYPILLLDDVFSELDDERQKVLFNIIKNSQTFITTTHKEFLDVVEGEKKIWEVSNGAIS
jgi:DNA replication and repair protein RecF